MVSNTLAVLLIWGAVLIGSFLLTSWVLSYARKRGLSDIPNERSSHQTPTPRGGGLAIVAAALLGWSGLAALGWIDVRAWAALVLGGGAVAGIGWLDDHRSQSAKIRLSVQIAAAICVVAILSDRIDFFVSFDWSPGFALSAVIAVLYLVWMTNLYNFMDGIDGIAGGQCVSVAVVLAAFLGTCGEFNLSTAYGVLAAAGLGFLWFNWHPARIFMGDVGSGFLGFAFGVLSLCHVADAKDLLGFVFPVVSTIAMGVFVVDSGITLARRFLRGQKVWLAHREHAYQKAVRAGYSHGRVSAAVILTNVLWLGPWVMLTFVRPDWTWGIALVAFLPLVALTLMYRAGTVDGATERQ